MLKYWLLTLLFVAGMASANDSGLYYDELRNGEGILLLRNHETFVVYFFTYGAYECIYKDESDQDNGSICDYNGQRWFYASVAPEPEDDEEPSTDTFDDSQFGGVMYATMGINYPEGEPHDLIPFVHNVGESIEIGKFVMRRNLDGWLMDVAPVGEYLDKDDPIYTRIFKFEKVLFKADETGISPK